MNARFSELIEALESLKAIPQPQADDYGEPINSFEVYDKLQPQYQNTVDAACSLAYHFVRKVGPHGQTPDIEAISALTKAGYRTSLTPGQDDPMALYGIITVDDKIKLDISDPT